MSKSKLGEPLVLYLAVSEDAMSGVLVREEGKTQMLVYYVSKSLQEEEVRYPKIEKSALTLVVSARKLRLYFHIHTILVHTTHFLRQVL